MSNKAMNNKKANDQDKERIPEVMRGVNYTQTERKKIE